MADLKKKNKLNSTLLLLIVGAIVLGAVVVMYPVYLKKEKLQASNYQLQKQLKDKQFERSDLNKKLYDLHTDPHAVEKVAREKFRLCREGEIILLYEKE